MGTLVMGIIFWIFIFLSLIAKVSSSPLTTVGGVGVGISGVGIDNWNYHSTGLNFNLPYMRWCSTCHVNQIQGNFFEEPTYGVDTLCEKFVKWRTDGWSLPSCIPTFLSDVKYYYPDYYWIFFSFFTSRMLYEELYNRDYTAEVYVTTNTNQSFSPTCLHVYSTGRFIPPIYQSHDKQEKQRHEKAFRLQEIWVQGVQDLWSITCESQYHKAYIKSAKLRIKNYREEVKSYSSVYDDLVELYKTNDVIPTAVLPSCKANGKYEHLSLLNSSCQEMYCFPPKSQEFADHVKEGEKLLNSYFPAVPSSQSGGDQSGPSNECSWVGGPTETANMEAASSCRTEVKRKDETYSIIINEISPDMIHAQSFTFLEIKKIGPPSDKSEKKKYSLKGVKLLIIKTKSQLIIAVVNMNNMNFEEGSNFFVLQDTDDNQKIYIRKSVELKSFLPIANDEPIAVVLIKRHMNDHEIPLEDWNRLNLRGRKNDIATVITDQMIQTIEMLDMQVYGHQNNIELPLIRKLSQKFYGCNFILNNHQVPVEVFETINYCPREKPDAFQYIAFKYGKPTPMNENDCNVNSQFLIGKSEHARFSPNSVFTTEGSTILPKTSRNCPIKSKAVSKVIEAIEVEIQAIKVYDPAYIYAFYPNEKMSSAIHDQLDPNFIGHAVVGTKFGPFEVANHRSNFAAKTLICRICRDRHEQASHSWKGYEIDMFTKPDGAQMTSSNLKRYMSEHVEKAAHYESVYFDLRNHRRNLAAKNGEKLKTSLPVAELAELKTLETHMLAAFGIVKMNTAVQNFNTLMKVIKRTGGITGEHLQSRYAVMEFIQFMGDEMHASIIAYLIYSQLPFSLLFDSSSDRKNRHYLLIYIMTQEGSNQITYLYKMKQMGKTSEAKDYLQIIKNAVEEDGQTFYHFFVNNLAAVITDGENTMKALHRLIDNWIGTKVFHVFCLAHKIQLSSRASLIPLKRDKELGPNSCLLEFANLELLLNNFHNFYKLASRRIGDLRESQSFNKVTVELTKVYTNRWITSEYETIKRFLRNYKPLVESLNSIIDDQGFNLKVRNDALQMIQQITDKTTMLLIVALQDYSYAFKVYSQKLQQSGSLLIDQWTPYNHLRNELEKQRNLQGEIVTGFLNGVQGYTDSRTKNGFTIDEYEATGAVTWQGKTLVENSYYTKASIMIPALTSKSLDKLANYVPLEDMESLHIFHPSAFPISIEQLLDFDDDFYKRNEITYVINKLGLPLEETLTAWNDLIKSILNSPHWGDYRRIEYASSFWLALLNDRGIKWNELSEKLVRKVLTIASGSVVCEQGFSSFGIVKNLQRNRISNSHLEAILRVLLNGPNTVDDFDATRYAVAWLKAGKFYPEQKPPGVNNPEYDPDMPDSDMIYGDDNGLLTPAEIDDIEPHFNVVEPNTDTQWDVLTDNDKKKQKIRSVLT